MRVCLRSVLLFAFFLTGCENGPEPATGGTQGVLKFGSSVTSDMVVHVFQKQRSAFQEIGFGNTSADGTFVLYSPGAKEPLFLTPGEFAFTLESVGPTVKMPKEFLKPESTPLKVTWTEGMPSLILEAPEGILVGK